ncbi:MAG: CapA family protein [Planctomycetota bacterium]|nr:CapA family protein [Planctomycetota bacterium]
MRDLHQIVLFLLIMSVLTGCRVMPGNSHANPDLIALATTDSEARILFVGDTSFGETYQSRLKEKGETNILESEGYEYTLRGLAPLLDDAHHVVANFETTVTDLPHTPLSGIKTYLHRANPAKTPTTLKAHHFTTLSLANNHSMDYGSSGLVDTLTSLDQHGLQYFGAGLNESEAQRPIHFNLKVSDHEIKVIVASGFESRTTYRVKYDFYAGPDKPGVNEWSIPKAKEHIRRLRQNAPEAFLIAYPHWGINYAAHTEKQTSLAHALIDSGADLVIGHGSHAIQAIEQYQGCWILYSLGNFMFNTPGRYAKKDCPPFSLAAMLQITASSTQPQFTLKLYPIFSDNRITKYQPRLVSDEEFFLVRAQLPILAKEEASPRFSYNDAPDQFGSFLRLDVTRRLTDGLE